MASATPDAIYASESVLAERCPTTAAATQVREGFAFSATDDRLFAMGWPHVRLVVAEHEDDDDPVTPIKEMIADEEERPYTVTWPLSVARRFVRALGMPIKYVQPKDAASVLKNGAPVGTDEARALLTHAVSRVGYHDGELIIHLVLLLEAMVGPEVVLDAAVSALEALPQASWAQRNGDAAHVIFQLGFVLLRASATTAPGYFERLRKLYGRATSETQPKSEQLDALDAVVNGSEGARRGGGKNREFYAHVTEAPELIAQVVADSDFAPDVRFVFLGGDPVVEALASQWKEYDHSDFLADLGRIQSPQVVNIVAAMVASSKVKKQAKTWLKTHAVYARPVLEQRAKGKGKDATQAKLALEELSK